jgi:hypothetical protein
MSLGIMPVFRGGLCGHDDGHHASQGGSGGAVGIWVAIGIAASSTDATVGARKTNMVAGQPKDGCGPTSREAEWATEGAEEFYRSEGSIITLFSKYSEISGSGKSVYSISFVKTMLPLPSSQVSAAVRFGRTTSFHN